MAATWPQAGRSAACGRDSTEKQRSSWQDVRCSSQERPGTGASLSRHFAMLMPSPLAVPAAAAEAEDGQSRLQAGLASRILSGPGLRPDWLEEIDRRGLVEELLAEGITDQAVATAPHGHQLDRALNAKTTPAVCPGRVPVPRRGLRRDLAHRLRHARPGPQARHPGPHRPGGSPVDWARSGHARGSVRSADPFSMRTSSGDGLRGSFANVGEDISALAALCRSCGCCTRALYGFHAARAWATGWSEVS